MLGLAQPEGAGLLEGAGHVWALHKTCRAGMAQSNQQQ
jgi:hypothetical protein